MPKIKYADIRIGHERLAVIAKATLEQASERWEEIVEFLQQ